MGNANTGQAWVPLSGTWGISGNKAYCASQSAGDINIEAGSANYSYSITLNCKNTGANLYYFNSVFRLLDTNNYLRVKCGEGLLQLTKFVAGTGTVLSSLSFTTTNDVDYRVKVICQGNRVVVYVDGILYIDYTLTGGETVFSTYTKVGLRVFTNAPLSFTARADDLIVEAL
jgi:hypothetical protein